MARLRLYRRYSVRSLRRGGQRTLLAVFCIAVGVMAVVALRLAGGMITDSLTSNVRQVLGGDVSVQANAVPLTAAEVQRVDDLRRGGLITDYLAIGSTTGTVRRPSGHISRLNVYVLDDPARFPLVGQGDVRQPGGATFGSLLSRPRTVVLTDFVATQAGAHVGDAVHLNVTRGGGVDATVTGVVANHPTAGGATLAYVSRTTYALVSTQAERFGLVDIIQPDPDKADQAASALRADFPTATVQTVKDALNETTSVSDDINRFLIIVGLLALLIGGVGIVNTMQVSLSRRRLEIAMLKTAGYRRGDLYGLFAIEAGILGLSGGAIGTAVGVGISALVRILVERVFLIDIVFRIDPVVLLTGITVGLATSLVFGLLPIVRAAAVRPQAVLRDQERTQTVGTALQTFLLYAILIVLFTALALSLIGSLTWTLATVVGTVVVIALLSGVFALIVVCVARLPVPERPRPGFLLAVTAACALAAVITYYVRAVGSALLILALTGYAVAVLPRRPKTALKLALRSLRRTVGRTSATLVALFVGVFTIGLILVLGQDISGKINDSLNTLTGFNVFAIASPADSARLRTTSATLPGLQERLITDNVPVTPVAVHGVPVGQLAPPQPATQDGEEQERHFGSLAGIQGYDLRSGSVPDAFVNLGRPLATSDSGTASVLLRADLHHSPFFVQVGDTITVTQVTSGRTVTLNVAGFYLPVSRGSAGLRFAVFLQPILADRAVVDAIAGSELQTVVSMKLDPGAKDAALHRIETAAPGVEVLDLADYAALINQFLSNLVVLLVAIASLALFAGIVIIGNTIALAMLERRREIGVLKAVGHSSRSVLSQVLVENGIVALVGAVAGMAAVTLTTYLLGRYLLSTDLAVGTPIVVAVVLGIVVLVTATATLVAWGPTRVRPLDVLRYE